MMKQITDIFSRGFRFMRDNPQLSYTVFLTIAIPLAFLYTSHQFLRVAQDQQNKLERNRIATLQDAFAAFVPAHANDPAYLDTLVRDLRAQNETITKFDIFTKASDGTYHIMVPVPNAGDDTTYTPDMITDTFQKPGVSYASEYESVEGRHWRAVRAIAPTASSGPIFIVTDILMAQSDAIARKNIQTAYLVLIGIVALIILLLARQARIIDYATLYVKLKEVDQMKDDFVSMAAHELRSPLTIIRGYVDIIKENGGELSEQVRKSLANIDASAQQLNTLIGDILDVARLQEGRMSFTFSVIEPAEIIGSIVDSFVHPAEQKGLTLSYEKTPLNRISADPDRFRQVLINLIGNAIKYTPKGGVRVTATNEANMVVIRVSDTGMGISAEEQQKLFQKFYRIKSEETKAITGTGLGLWITAQMVKTMKGTITVESIKGKGTDFIVSFPKVEA